jgi:hypothetical protein
MEKKSLVNSEQVSGRISEEKIYRWRHIAQLMASLETIASDGITAIVKIDGERPDAIFTVVISGLRLGDSFFRKDGSDIEVLLQEAIAFYSAREFKT